MQLLYVDDTILTTRQREYWSIATNKYFELGSGRRKPMVIVYHGCGGKIEGSNGSGVGLFDTSANNRHSDIFSFNFPSILTK